MCGVFGYVGQQTDVGETILTALKTLEYRGYDSWGLALSTPEDLVVHKDVGRINGHVRSFPSSTQGIGHTRWATHGGVAAVNSHPHLDCLRRIAVVHNGIIENHVDLRAQLLQRGHRLESETDSDVVAHLVEEELAAGSDLGHAVAKVFGLLEGYNAVVVMDRLQQQFAATKRVSPLVLGRSARGSTVASDAIALNGHADELIYLEDDQLGHSQRRKRLCFRTCVDESNLARTSHPAGPEREHRPGTIPGFLVQGSCAATGGAASAYPRRPRGNREPSRCDCHSPRR